MNRAHLDPPLDGHAQDHCPDAGGCHIGDQDEHDGGGDVIEDVVQLGEHKVQPAHIAPQHTGGNAHGSFDDRHEKGDGQAGARARPDARPQVLSDGVGAPEKALLPRGDVAVLDAGGGSTAQRFGSACPGSSGCTKANTTTAASAASSATASLFLKKARKVLPQ